VLQEAAFNLFVAAGDKTKACALADAHETPLFGWTTGDHLEWTRQLKDIALDIIASACCDGHIIDRGIDQAERPRLQAGSNDEWIVWVLSASRYGMPGYAFSDAISMRACVALDVLSRDSDVQLADQALAADMRGSANLVIARARPWSTCANRRVVRIHQP
jgi:hypothetical protein